jgi:acyl-CoA-binding protein
LSQTLTLSTQEAATWVVVHESGLDSDTRLSLYGLYKQATVGPCPQTTLLAGGLVAMAKRQSWRALGELGSAEAMNRYVLLVLKLLVANEDQNL